WRPFRRTRPGQRTRACDRDRSRRALRRRAHALACRSRRRKGASGVATAPLTVALELHLHSNPRTAGRPGSIEAGIIERRKDLVRLAEQSEGFVLLIERILYASEQRRVVAQSILRSQVEHSVRIGLPKQI